MQREDTECMHSCSLIIQMRLHCAREVTVHMNALPLISREKLCRGSLGEAHHGGQARHMSYELCIAAVAHVTAAGTAARMHACMHGTTPKMGTV